MPHKAGIYKIENVLNGKFYIGQSSRLVDRLYNHKRLLTLNQSHNPHLQNAWNKYGADNFNFSVLVYLDKSNLDLFEQRLVDNLKPQYNIRKECKSNSGFKHSEETKEKIRQSQIGKIINIETRKKISASKTGKKDSPETLKDKSIRMMGHTLNKGRKQPQEEKDKRAQSVRDYWKTHTKTFPKGTGEKISQALKSYFSGGGKSGSAKITKEEVIQMRLERKLYKTTYASLGRKFGVASNTAEYICKGKLWKHVREGLDE